MGKGAVSGNSGQSTIEFALTLLVLLAFVFFFIQLALVFAYGNYVHYATFMSARAYLSAGQTGDDQIERAQDVAVRMLKRTGQPTVDRFPMLAKGDDSKGAEVPGLEITPPTQYSETDRNSSWMQGVRYTFRSRLFLLPLGRSASRQLESVTLTSESWLGHEPSWTECQDDMGKMHGLFDNGC